VIHDLLPVSKFLGYKIPSEDEWKSIWLFLQYQNMGECFNKTTQTKWRNL